MSLISGYLNQQGTLSNGGTTNVNGEKTFGTPRIVRLRYEDKRTMVRTATGDQVLSNARVFLEPGETVTVGDRITYNGRRFEVLSIEGQQGFDSLSQQVVYLGG